MEHAMQTQEQRDISSLEESLRLGQSLHLEFEGLPTLNGGYSLWGVCPNESIMVSAPQLELSQPLLNMPVKARLFIKHLDSACAFRTSVSYLSPSASPYVHLLMPTRVIRGEAWKNDRANINLPCQLEYKGERTSDNLNGIQSNSIDHKTIEAKMLDASICGCRIDTVAHDLRVGDHISMVFKIRVFNIDKEIELTAMIRSRYESESGFSLGAQFLEMKDSHRIALSSFLEKHR